MKTGLYVEYRLFLSDSHETTIFPLTAISNFMQNHPVGAEIFHSGGPTDKYDESNSRLSKFFDRSKKTGDKHS
jgi:hypothetical protein